jgi:tetratricopeptide (TPR) repeat protein
MGVKALNNQAVYLISIQRSHEQAISILQRALILSRGLVPAAESERHGRTPSPGVISGSASGSARIESSSADESQSDIIINDESVLQSVPTFPNGALVSGTGNFERPVTLELDDSLTGVSAGKSVEYDEGLNTFSDAVSISPSGEEALRELPHNDRNSALEAIVCFNLAICYAHLGHVPVEENRHREEALLYFTLAQKLLENISPVSPFPDLSSVAVLHNQGLLHFRSKRYTEALSCYNDALDRATVQYGTRKDLHVAATLNCIGVVSFTESCTKAASPQHDNDSDTERIYHEKALGLFTESLSIRLAILGQDTVNDRDTATVINNIGRVKFRQRDFEGSLSFYKEAYQMRKALCGEQHIDFTATAFNTGQSLHFLGRADEALDYYQEYVKAIFTGDIRLLDIHTVIALESIGELFHEDGSEENADAFYELALKLA